jgi:1,4-alpha-glucan branching enzyme
MDSTVLTAPPSGARRIMEARHHDPFEYLGKHREGNEEVVRCFIPDAVKVRIADADLTMHRMYDSDIFEWRGKPGLVPEHYRLVWTTSGGHSLSQYDPYTFAPQLSDFDLHLFAEGKHNHAYRFLGANPHIADGIQGILFAVWAPNAERVSLVGNFNRWDGRCHPLRVRGGGGVWELFVPGLAPGEFYKFEIRNRDSGSIFLKTDPYGQQFEVRPQTAAVVSARDTYTWGDQAWIEARQRADWLHTPMSIYEVHLGSWQLGAHGEFLSYKELAHRLIPYVKSLGFSHIELMPITEHPYDGSWGYQTTGYFAPTSRHGSPDDFRYFVDYCHQHGIGVVLDWVPAHFPKDSHGLAWFDGTALYEHQDPRRGEHRDWGTLIFNFGRNEVKNFLVSSAIFWLEEYHIDGLRVDAVASMLYLDYSREAGDWTPNQYGGNENLEAIDFLREVNALTHQLQPGTVMFAEESTAWPMVSRPTWLGGLGFTMKWNMGWMNDTLEYMSKNPIFRPYHHDMLTFSQLYAFTENFVLPFSHDEVVHGKQSMIYKMPGDEWQRFANLRLLYTYMYTHPGKKLLFMGNEFAQGREWDHATQLDWYVLDYAFHQGTQRLVGDLNRLYTAEPALYRHDFEPQGFEWIDCHDSSQSVLSFLRRDGEDFLVVILNFTPVPRHDYRIGVPFSGSYNEIMNSDSEYYGGSNLGNGSGITTEDQAWMGRPYSIRLTLPPLGAIILKRG